MSGPRTTHLPVADVPHARATMQRMLENALDCVTAADADAALTRMTGARLNRHGIMAPSGQLQKEE